MIPGFRRTVSRFPLVSFRFVRLAQQQQGYRKWCDRRLAYWVCLASEAWAAALHPPLTVKQINTCRRDFKNLAGQVGEVRIRVSRRANIQTPLLVVATGRTFPRPTARGVTRFAVCAIGL